MTNHPGRSKAKPSPLRDPTPEEIRALREEHKLSQTAAAGRALTSLRSWQNWESGERRMHPAVWQWFQCTLFEDPREHIAEVLEGIEAGKS